MTTTLLVAVSGSWAVTLLCVLTPWADRSYFFQSLWAAVAVTLIVAIVIANK